MRRRSSPRTRAAHRALGTLGAIGAAVLAACGSEEPLAPGLDTRLVGVWASPREPLSPQGSWQRTLTITSGGRIARSGVTYGLYADQAPNALSADVTLYGRIDALPGAFVVRPDSVVTHDGFYGPAHRDVQRGLGPGRDTTRYAIDGDVLTLTYYTYPADAPVLTTETLRRVAIVQ